MDVGVGSDNCIADSALGQKVGLRQSSHFCSPPHPCTTPYTDCLNLDSKLPIMENLLSLVNSSDIELSSDSKFWVVFPHNFFSEKASWLLFIGSQNPFALLLEGSFYLIFLLCYLSCVGSYAVVKSPPRLLRCFYFPFCSAFKVKALPFLTFFSLQGIFSSLWLCSERYACFVWKGLGAQLVLVLVLWQVFALLHSCIIEEGKPGSFCPRKPHTAECRHAGPYKNGSFPVSVLCSWF